MKAERRRASLAVLIVVPVVLWALFEAAAPARERARRTKCYSNLKNAFGYALHLYSRDFAEAFPPTIGYLYPSYHPSGHGFLCPSAGKATLIRDDPALSSDNYTPAMFGDTHTDYVYVSGLTATDKPHYVLAFDDEWNHDGKGVNVVFLGSNVDWWDVKELHEWLAWQEKDLAAQGRKMKLLRPAWSSWPDPPPGGRPWYSRRGGRAVAVGAFVGVAVALALIVRKVRRGRGDGGTANAE